MGEGKKKLGDKGKREGFGDAEEKDWMTGMR